jgi:cytochrome c biogenesis protein CcmG, thiol:disulfide interchange protein DsbE
MATAASTQKRNLTPALLIGGFVVLIVALAAVIAIVTSGGENDKGSDAIAEQLSVTVIGNPLPPYSGQSPVDAADGLAAPQLLGSAFDGTPLAVVPGGGPKLVVFLAHWCPACNEEVPELVKWYESGRVPEELEVIGVSTGVRPDAANYPPSAWLRKKGWPWPAMADSPEAAAAQAYGVTGYPTSVVIGTDGTVLDRVSGVLGLEAYEGFIENALSRDTAAG